MDMRNTPPVGDNIPQGRPIGDRWTPESLNETQKSVWDILDLGRTPMGEDENFATGNGANSAIASRIYDIGLDDHKDWWDGHPNSDSVFDCFLGKYFYPLEDEVAERGLGDLDDETIEGIRDYLYENIDGGLN